MCLYECIFIVNVGVFVSSCILDFVFQEYIGSIDIFEVFFVGWKGQVLGSFMFDCNCLDYIVWDFVNGQDFIVICYLNGNCKLLVNFCLVIEGYVVFFVFVSWKDFGKFYKFELSFLICVV